jgi:hypothetical protein
LFPFSLSFRSKMGNSNSNKPASYFSPLLLKGLNESYATRLPSFLPAELASRLETESIEEWIKLAQILTTPSKNSKLFVDLFVTRFTSPYSLLSNLVLAFQGLYKWEHDPRFLAYLQRQVGDESSISTWFNKSHLVKRIWAILFARILFSSQPSMIIPSTTHTSRLLSPHDLLVLDSYINTDDRTKEWTRSFSSQDDGNAWTPFVEGVTAKGSTIIVIQDKNGMRFFN